METTEEINEEKRMNRLKLNKLWVEGWKDGRIETTEETMDDGWMMLTETTDEMIDGWKDGN